MKMLQRKGGWSEQASQGSCQGLMKGQERYKLMIFLSKIDFAAAAGKLQIAYKGAYLPMK
jgi:hypothetical protein